MTYTVKLIEEDLDFGCEERAEGTPTMAIVTLIDESGEEQQIKMEDDMLYERGIHEYDKVYFDADNQCPGSQYLHQQHSVQPYL